MAMWWGAVRHPSGPGRYRSLVATDIGQRRRRRAGDVVRLPARPVREIGPYHRATMPAGKALAIMLIALLVGGLLNVRSLTEAAERQPFGLKRDVSLVLVWPFQQVSGLLGLDAPRAALSERLGRIEAAGTAGGGTTTEDAPSSAVAGGEGPSDVLAAAAAAAGRVADGPEVAGANAIADIDPDAVAELPDRLAGPFTTTDPLSIAVIGDSLTEQLGPAIIDRTSRPGVTAMTTHDFRYSSGLTRPDFFDWPAQAAQIAEAQDPDLWVVMLGANDAQDVRDEEGRFRQIGSDEWEAIYTGRIGALMDLLVQDGRGVIWVGQPIMRDAPFDESMAYLSSLYDAEARKRPLVSFVDSRAVFADADGRYADYLPGPGGQLEQMRLPDGVHLTRAGAQRLAEQVLPLLPIVTDPDAPAIPAGDDPSG